MSVEHGISGSGSRLPARSGVTGKQRTLLLEALEQGFTITRACELAGTSRSRVNHLREREPEFAESLAEAVQAGIDRIEDELVKAARDGWEELDVHEEQGTIVRRVTRQRRDPRLLAKVREWRRPPATRVEVDYKPPPIVASGRRVTSVADVVQLFVETGQSHLLDLGKYGIDMSELVVDGEAEELPPEGEGGGAGDSMRTLHIASETGTAAAGHPASSSVSGTPVVPSPSAEREEHR